MLDMLKIQYAFTVTTAGRNLLKKEIRLIFAGNNYIQVYKDCLLYTSDNGQVVDTNLENDKRSAIHGSISEISPALHCELYSVNIVTKTVWVIDCLLYTSRCV